MAAKIKCINNHVYEDDPDKIDDLVVGGVLRIKAECPVCDLPLLLVP